MIPAADLIRLILIAEGVGVSTNTTTSVWPIYVSFLPDLPDNALVVYDTTGVLQGRAMGSGEVITKPGIQVRVRASNHPTGYAKAQAVTEVLDAIRKERVVIASGVFAGTYVVENVARTADILPMGVEGEGTERRHNFTINALLTARKE
jgi:hypothetical protein